MKTLLRIALCLALVTGTVTAQGKSKRANSPRRVAFETEFKNAMDEMQVVGVSIAVVKDNKIVFNNSYGYKNLETKELVDNNTMFRIASISKSFSATSIMQLVEQGKVTLDTDINDILDFKVRNPKYPDVPITVEMLLSHTSSLNDNEGYKGSLDVCNVAKSENAHKAFNDYKPGTKYDYCNLNFSLLGSIIERLSGERFDLYIDRHILIPLSLKASFNINEVPAKHIAKLYTWDGTKMNEDPAAYTPVTGLENYQLGVSSTTFSPAGGMKISARTLAKYMLMHMNYGKSPLAQTRIISEESAKCMQRDHTPGYQYGLALEQTNEFTPDEVMVGHTGDAHGLRSAMFFNPEKKYGLVVITSGSNNTETVLQKLVPIVYKHFLKK